MKLPLAITVVVMQVLALAFMAGEREWIARTGRTVVLRTAPLDPRDPMRGDYLRLNYEISNVPQRLCRDGVLKLFAKNSDPMAYRTHRDFLVYATLQVSPEGLAEVVALSDQKPASGLFLRGRVQSVWGKTVQVRWGLEAIFMQQGRPLELEKKQREEFRGVPLDVEVAVGASGTGVYRRHYWEALGIEIELDRPSATERSRQPGEESHRQRPLTGLTVVLKNRGTEAVAIVDLPQQQSFRLVADESWAASRFRWAGENRVQPTPQASAVRVLKPGEEFRTHIDLTRPEWFVTDAEAGARRAEPIPLQSIRDLWAAHFRIEYAPPPASATQSLPHAAQLQHRRLRSAVFTASAGFD